MSKRFEDLLTGKAGEHRVFAELMKRGLIPYVPLVDEGIDCLLRDGTKIQVKTIKTQPRWFQIRNLVPEDNFYIIGIDADDEFWVFPSRVFAQNATMSKGIFDLNLDSKGRGDKLKNYKGAWDLITRTSST